MVEVSAMAATGEDLAMAAMEAMDEGLVMVIHTVKALAAMVDTEKVLVV